MDEKRKQDELVRALVRLRAIRDNFNSDYPATPSDINNYYEALDHLTNAGYNVAEFRFRDDELVVGRPGDNNSPRDHVMPRTFLAKVQSVLDYFSLSDDISSGRGIGFQGPTGQ